MHRHLSMCIEHLTTNIRQSKSPFPSDLMKSSSCLDESLSTIPTGVLLRESTDYLTIVVTSSIMCGTSCLNSKVGIRSSSHCLVGMFIMICSTSCESIGLNLSKIRISLCCGVYFGKLSRLSLILV